MTSSPPPFVERAIEWRRSGGDVMYEAESDGVRLGLRVNDFPVEPLYTLFADGAIVAHLEAWPARWVRPVR